MSPCALVLDSAAVSAWRSRLSSGNVLLAELADEPACRLGEARRVRDRAEVAIRLACDLGGVAAGRHRREGAPTSLDQAVLAEPNPELAERREAHVEQSGAVLGDQALEVRAQKDAADEHVDRRQGVATARIRNRLEERRLERSERAVDEPKAGARCRHPHGAIINGHGC